MAGFSLPAPAKLNLFLHITGRRPDGYHELQTVFQLLEYHDVLHFEASPAGIEVSVDGADIPAAGNLVLRAGQALAEQAGVNYGARVRLEKRIPIGGGMGGGSSDAATALVGLNLLWGLGLDQAALMTLGRRLGADVPVFIGGKSAWAEGIGERLTPIELSRDWYVVIYPGVQVPTERIFTHQDLTRDTSPITIARFSRPVGLWNGLHNDCEQIARRLYPEIDATLGWLEEWGTARMTGTGSCVFLATSDRAFAESILEHVPTQWTSFVTRGTQQSALVEASAQIRKSFQH
ncbi:MAG: 4-(cytidine 5'-diphospho)-2-C-methyl-D-erythritol kinase [Proteobacteria bacterium]|nr:4-(cytidine 5'-diphospho)-2-C-methyl-D-erythritol kinase [Pseudomonadota bacterium]MDA1298508.1 4-(cytidine 5'-diphospho)-2-C-methyl-D-erythritol kinase [Pseudomonadota bacterium]